MIIKISAVSDEGKTISQHFGMAAYFFVMKIENGRITKHQRRDHLRHSHTAGEYRDHEQPGKHKQGFGRMKQDHHASMLEAVRDCLTQLAGGRGSGVHCSIQQAGITPIITTKEKKDETTFAAAEGTLEDHIEKLQ